MGSDTQTIVTDPKILKYTAILEKNGIQDTITSVEEIVPELVGEHFASTVSYVNLSCESGKVIKLFVKKVVRNEEFSKTIRDLQLFDKEAAFFQLIDQVREFITTKTKDSGRTYELDMIPKCLFGDGDEIVLENLCDKGYIILDKVKRQNLEQATIVMKTLAKLHASTYVMFKERGWSRAQVVEQFPMLCDAMDNEKGDAMITSWFNFLVQAAQAMIKASGEEGTEEALKALDDINADFVGLARRIVNLPDAPVFICVNHGDCWNNNMMFKLEDEQDESSIKHTVLVDFQVCRVGSPCLDLSYYFYTSVKHEVRRQNWRNLLAVYYDELVTCVQDLGSSVDFSLEDLIADFTKRGLFGFTFGLAVSGNFEAAKDFGDLDQVEGDVVDHMSKKMDMWVQKNPERAKSIGSELVFVMQEYYEFSKP